MGRQSSEFVIAQHYIAVPDVIGISVMNRCIPSHHNVLTRGSALGYQNLNLLLWSSRPSSTHKDRFICVDPALPQSVKLS